MTLSFNFKQIGVPFVPYYENPHQQTRSGWSTNLSQQHNLIYLPLSYHRTPIVSQPQQKKTIKKAQDHSDFILPNMILFLPLKHQNHMSNSLNAWILKMYLTLLLLLSLLWVINLDYLDPNIMKIVISFCIVEWLPSRNSTLDLFRLEVDFSVEWLIRGNKQPHR